MLQSIPKIHNGAGAARYLGHPETWGRIAFRDGILPIEGYLNDRYPVITEATLKRLAPKLRKIKLN